MKRSKTILYFMSFFALLIFVVSLRNDYREQRKRTHVWSNAILATAPQLIADGNLVKLDALIRTETEISTLICTNEGQELLVNLNQGGHLECVDNSKILMLKDSRPIGFLIVRGASLASYHKKYLAIILITALLMFIFWSNYRRREEIQLIDGVVLALMSKDFSRLNSLTQTHLGRLSDLVASVVGYYNSENKIRELQIEAAKNKAITLLSEQVAHDIRSPLLALEMVSSRFDDVPTESREILINAIKRIRDICSTLGRKKSRVLVAKKDISQSLSSRVTNVETYNVFDILRALIQEKKVEYQDFSVDIKLGEKPQIPIFLKVDSVELNRIVSNLINNSIEAESSSIQVELEVDDAFVLITVTDNGIGIQNEVLEKIGAYGFTHGKKDGTGLGVFSSKKKIDEWGGQFQISSVEGIGTKVQLRLPIKNNSHDNLGMKLIDGSELVFIDTQSEAVQEWIKSLKEDGRKFRFFRLSNELDLRKFHRETFLNLDSPVYLIQLEAMGGLSNALTLVEDLGVAKCSILFGNNLTEKDVKECRQHQVRLISESQLRNLEIETMPKVSSLL